MQHPYARIGIVVMLSYTAAVSAAEPDSAAFFRDLAQTRDYSLGLPAAAKLTPDGKTAIYLRGGARDPVLRLYELDVASGAERELVTPAQLAGGAEETLSAEERARRERARISTRGFTTFDLSRDGEHLLLTLSGKLYVLERATLRTVELPGEQWIDPRFSPDGRYVAAVAGNELNVIDLETLAAKPVTSGSTATVHHGVAEFVAQEEMTRREGYWWSSDSASLIYQRNDESGVEVRYISDPLEPASAPQAFFYPRAGSANTDVRLGIVARGGGPTQWIEWNRAEYPYLARVVWSEAAAPPVLLVQDRAQQKQVLVAVDPATGATRPLLEEADPAWLNLDDAGTPRWFADGSHFVWTTERAGAWQVELRRADGSFVRFLTPPDFGYRALVALDEAQDALYVLGGTDSRETHLWRFPLAGGDGEPLTREPGDHGAAFAKDGGSYVHTFNLLDGRRGSEVVARGGLVRALPSVAETPPALPTVELTRTDGAMGFDAAITRPRDFDSDRKYPVILYVYAGPGVKWVNATRRSYFVDQWMADHGYVVVRIDGRGTPRRGRDWERAIRGDLIDVALADQVAALEALGAKYPELDLERTGVTGWSFGGYFSAMAVLKRPDVFRAAVAGAPVVTWENYDTHYTERYLGLPQADADAYRASNVTTYANELSRPLLLIHGLTDDNVYAQHTLQLIDALFRAGKPYEFMPMLGTHMISDPEIRRNQQQRVMDFFARTLPPAE